ncbi:hypothetical protein KAU40_02110 [Candidatus Parcubacteria bacterium]|nr:hypothetical protein [Candidatus Parcubacteria bacterium]
MFYKCPKCKKVWQYPIAKCPDCFLELERIKTQKAKVIGVCKTIIPTLLHPKIPYFILLLEDEKGNKWAHKSIKEYKITEDFDIEKSSDKNAVAVWRIKYDILEAIEKNIELLGGIEINQDTKILILPTLVSPTHPYFRDNTSPQFLKAVLEFLFENNLKPENIKVGAESSNEISIEKMAQKSGLLQVCLENKIEPLDLVKAKQDFKPDIILNLPILKIGKASAMENIIKILGKSHAQISKKLGQVKQTKILTLAEAGVVQKSDKFTTFLGLVLVSYNALNLDRVFNEIVMTKDLPEILKTIKIEDIPVVGRAIEEVQH